MSIWLLPESIADVLPSEARKSENLRRTLLDRFRVYGYEMVMPPLLEYLESLLAGGGEDLGLRTFKLVDQLSGRTMGVRADITPQVSRIDAHLLNRPGVTRLCYAGSVLETRPRGLHATREPYQIGAELYGHGGIEADLEIQQLLLDSVALVGLQDVRLDLGHAGILSALFEWAPAAAVHAYDIFGALAGKDVPRLHDLTAALEPQARDALRALPTLYGERDVLERARGVLPPLPAIGHALDDLDCLATQAALPAPGVRSGGRAQVQFDLADLGGSYQYHTGVIFSAYVAGVPNAIARGGRYDRIGRLFGRDRPAIGFSLDLRELARISPVEARSSAVFAPWTRDAALSARIAALRDAGEIVIQALPGHPHDLDEFACDRELVARDGEWVLVDRQII
ncbi:MAG: ATP phosphoribosyltransferase regulatory subunit [Janthinobacterium lividum]